MAGRRFFIPSITWLAIGLLMGMGWPAALLAAEKVKVATVVSILPLYYLPLMAGLEKGFWGDEGLEVEWAPFRGTEPMGQALAAKAIEIGLSKPSTLLLLAARGMLTSIVADLEGFYRWHFYVINQSPIKGKQDLKGRKLGVSGRWSHDDALAVFMVKKLGLDREVKLVGVGGIREKLASLQAGVVDVIASTDQGQVKLEAEGITRRVVSLAELSPEVEEWDPTTLFTTKELLGKDPPMVKKVVAGTLKAVDFVMRDSEWSIARIRRESGFSEEVAKRAYGQLRYSASGAIYPGRLQGLRQFMIENRLVPKEKTPLVEEMYSDKFVAVK